MKTEMCNLGIGTTTPTPITNNRKPPTPPTTPANKWLRPFDMQGRALLDSKPTELTAFANLTEPLQPAT